jgi:squalene-associated FAD-dependent desaturase
MELETEASVIVVGAGVAGMSASCALADAGLRVQLVERRSYLGGRASSYLHPGVNEVIDNCQHVLFGCCTNLTGFYKRIGVADRIYWTSEMTMIEPGGRRSPLGPSKLGPLGLPAPLHALPRLLSAKAFSWNDKKSLARAFSTVLRFNPKDCFTQSSLGDWLRRNEQTEGAIERFWRVVIASALNADINSIALSYAAKVIRELFMNSAFAGSMGMSTVPLSELYRGAEKFLQDHEARVIFNAGVDAAEWDEESSQWTVATRAGVLMADYLVLALPFEATAKLVPHMPPVEGVDDLVQQMEHHEHWPICSVHLWFDREITDLDHAVLLDREIHWMYNKSRIQPERKGNYIELVISASRSFAEKKREDAIDQAVSELAEFFPAAASARLEKAALVKEVRATFGVPPGIDAYRPHSASPWPNCILAGDWTATGWPSTMESAVRSGHLAAEAVCDAVGKQRKFLVPDLKPRGFMRFVK